MLEDKEVISNTESALDVESLVRKFILKMMIESLMIKPGGEISVKYYFVLIIMIHALITGTVVAGTAADKTGQTPTAAASDPALSPAVAAEDDAFETDIFQEGQAYPGNHAMIADPLEGLNRAVIRL